MCVRRGKAEVTPLSTGTRKEKKEDKEAADASSQKKLQKKQDGKFTCFFCRDGGH